MNLEALNQIKNAGTDPLSQLQMMFSSVSEGQAESPMDFLMQGAFTQVEIEIPVGYGITLTVRLPQKLLEEQLTDVERFILDKLLNSGGALYISVDWIEMGIVDVLVYLNTRCGLVAVVRSAPGVPIPSAMLDIIFKVLNKLIEKSVSQVDINLLEWSQLEEFFNRIYYSGLLRTSKDTRYLNYKVQL